MHACRSTLEDPTRRTYRWAPHVFNAKHWVNSVTVARHYGSMIGETYIELRYEDLVQEPKRTSVALLSQLGIAPNEEALDEFAASIDATRHGKHKLMPRRARSEAEAILRPTLESFGYGLDEGAPRWPRFWRR